MNRTTGLIMTLTFYGLCGCCAALPVALNAPRAPSFFAFVLAAIFLGAAVFCAIWQEGVRPDDQEPPTS